MTTENQTNVLETLVGEDKKFKTVEDLAKGKLEADKFIQSLIREKETLLAELEKAQNGTDRKKILENLMSNLANQNTTTDTSTTTDDQTSNRANNQPAGLSHDDVVKLLEQREREQQQARNYDQAMTPFKKLYGDKTAEVLAAKAKELGMSVEELESLAKRSPQAFLTVTGTNARDNSTRSMAAHGSSIPPVGTGADSSIRNKAWYDAKMKEMGPLNFMRDAKLQVQLHKDMAALGDAWDS